MSGTDMRRYGKVFDDRATEYDNHRPTYPEQLIDQVCAIAGLTTGDPVLEIGCGSGQLTRSLAARGLRITVIEPGKQLLDIARQHLQGTKNASFINARFEDTTFPPCHFKAIFSASAIHWVDPDVGWQNIADTLLPGGVLALMQYFGLDEDRSIDDQKALLAIMKEIAPEVAATWPTYRTLNEMLAGTHQRRDNVSAVWAWLGSYDLERPYAAQLFHDVQIAIVPTLVQKTADEINAVGRTMSYYARLTSAQQQALEHEYKELNKQLGRPIRASTVAVVVTARRRTTTQGAR